MNSIKDYFVEIQHQISVIDNDNWTAAGKVLLNAYQDDQNVWIAGNGGNFANALHFATDWSKGLHLAGGKALKARAIGENSALSSAYSNDLGFENQIEHYLKMLASENDVAVLMTAGGSSINILNGARKAREMGLHVIGITGGSGLEFKSLFDVHVHVPTSNIQVVEDVHAMFGHAMLKYLVSQINDM